jgi:hypothetical protein
MYGPFQVRPLHQRGQAFGGRGIAAVVEIIQIERTGKALDLDLRRLGFRFAQIVEHPRAYQAHDEPDDRDHDQDLDQRKARLAVPGAPPTLGRPQ